MPVEQNDEWAVQRARYMTRETMMGIGPKPRNSSNQFMPYQYAWKAGIRLDQRGS